MSDADLLYFIGEMQRSDLPKEVKSDAINLVLHPSADLDRALRELDGLEPEVKAYHGERLAPYLTRMIVGKHNLTEDQANRLHDRVKKALCDPQQLRYMS